MLFPLCRVVAVVVSTLIFSTIDVNAQNNEGNSSSEASECHKKLEEDKCDAQWWCDWKYDDEGNGYCTDKIPDWVWSVISIAIFAGCVWWCCYGRGWLQNVMNNNVGVASQRRRIIPRPRVRNNNVVSHQFGVQMKPIKNPVAPSVSSNPVRPTASYGKQPDTQQPYTKPYNQAYNKPQAAYTPQAAYDAPPSYQYGGAPTPPPRPDSTPPPGYEPYGHQGAASII